MRTHHQLSYFTRGIETDALDPCLISSTHSNKELRISKSERTHGRHQHPPHPTCLCLIASQKVHLPTERRLCGYLVAELAQVVSSHVEHERCHRQTLGCLSNGHFRVHDRRSLNRSPRRTLSKPLALGHQRAVRRSDPKRFAAPSTICPISRCCTSSCGMSFRTSTVVVFMKADFVSCPFCTVSLIVKRI